MARFSGIYRRALWLSCLFCALFLVATADASTRKFVKLPSKGSVAQNPSAPSSRSGDKIHVTGQPGVEFIPASEGGSKGTSLKVIPAVESSLPAIYKYAKTGMKGGALGVAGSVALGVMLDQVDAFIDENTGVPQKLGEQPFPTTSLYWCMNAGTNYCDNSSLARTRLPSPGHFPALYELMNPASDLCSIVYSNDNNGVVTAAFKINNPGKCGDRDGQSNVTFYRRGVCPTPSFYSVELMLCVESGAPVPLDDSDYDLMFDYANQQNAEWLNGLLKDVCNGSNNPSGCFNELLDQAPLGGPSTLKGPSTTKTTTSVGPDGVTSQTVTTTNTNYDITYGDNYFDYRKTETTETKKNGVTESETTETEPEEVEQEEKPEEEEEKEDEDPSPCAGTNCDGPAYEDQYEPTEEEKEDSIDDYMSRVQDIPILVALGGMFDISVSGSCPIWELHHAMPIMGTAMNIDLVFDFLCVSWFVSYGPWIRAVIYAVAAFAAVRVGLL